MSQVVILANMKVIPQLNAKELPGTIDPKAQFTSHSYNINININITAAAAQAAAGLIRFPFDFIKDHKKIPPTRATVGMGPNKKQFRLP